MLIRIINVISLIMLLAGCGSVAVKKHPTPPDNKPAALTAGPARVSAPVVVQKSGGRPLTIRSSRARFAVSALAL